MKELHRTTINSYCWGEWEMRWSCWGDSLLPFGTWWDMKGGPRRLAVNNLRMSAVKCSYLRQPIINPLLQFIALLFTIVYCSEPTKRYWDSPEVASRILVTQARATALLSCRNATCGFRSAEPPDWKIQRHLWGAFGICAAQLTFQNQGAWSCHRKSYKSARACKCNLHCCCLPAINSLILT